MNVCWAVAVKYILEQSGLVPQTKHCIGDNPSADDYTYVKPGGDFTAAFAVREKYIKPKNLGGEPIMSSHIN